MPSFSPQDFDRIRSATRSAIEKHRLPGLSAGIVTSEGLVFAESAGVADIESGEALTPEHGQRIASITKTMVGLCAMALIDEGKLSLDDKVSDLLPDVVVVPITTRPGPLRVGLPDDADATGLRGLADRFDGALNHVVAENHLDLNLGKKVHDIFGAAIKFSMALLAAEPFRLGHGNSLKADLLKRFLHLVQLEWLYNCFNFLHRLRVSE